jgi:aminoglycoside/choline kinase family phosphotransferase
LNEKDILKLSASCGYASQQAVALKNEASGREYWRLIQDDTSFILCFLDPQKGSHAQFIKIANIFLEHQINSPKVLCSSSELGITIQDDLGDLNLLQVGNSIDYEELTLKCLDLLIEIQTIPNLNIPPLESADLINQMMLFSEIFCNQFLDVKVDSSIEKLIEKTSSELSIQPHVNCHFDFERRNLILSERNEIFVIDFQDLSRGPIGIDLAGILLDHYRSADHGAIRKALKYFQAKSHFLDGSIDAFELFRWGGVQRNLRILGVLSRLHLHEDKGFRLKDMPLILKNLISIIPDNWACKEYLIEEIEPKLKSKLLMI